MDVKSVSVTLDADDMRVMASALRLYHRTCLMSDADEQRIKALVHVAERSGEYQGRCYAEVIGMPRPVTDTAPGGQPVGDGGSAI